MRTSSVNVSVSFSRRLLKAIDKLAKRENCARAELLRTAVHVYICQRTRFDTAVSRLRQEARKAGYKPKDVESWIAEVRKKRNTA